MTPELFLWAMQPQLHEQLRDLQIHHLPVPTRLTEFVPDPLSKAILHVIHRLPGKYFVLGESVVEPWVSDVADVVVLAGLAVHAVDDGTPVLQAEQLGVLDHAVDQRTRSFNRNGPRIVRNKI